MDYRYELDISWLKQSSPEQAKHNDYISDTPPALPEKPPRHFLEAIRKESISNDLLLHDLESASYKNPLKGPRVLPQESYHIPTQPLKVPSQKKLPNPLSISPNAMNPIQQPLQSLNSPQHLYSPPKLPTLPQLPLKMLKSDSPPHVSDMYTKPLPKTPMERDPSSVRVLPPEPLSSERRKSLSPLRVETSDSFGVFGRKSSPLKSTPTESPSKRSWPSPTKIYQKLTPERSFRNRDSYSSDEDESIPNDQFTFSDDIEIYPEETNLDDTLDEITYLLEENRLNPSQTLPELPFTPNSLLPSDFDALEYSNLLSSIWDWCIRLFEKNLRKLPNYNDLLKCLYLLLNYWFPTLSHYYLEEQAGLILQELIQQGAISLSEDNLQIVPNYDAYVNGVMLGLVCCYGQHYDNGDYSQCYRPSCAYGKNTFNIQLSKPPLDKVDSSLPVQERIIQYTSGSWDDFWGVSLEQVKGLPPKTYELQATIFELILSELRTARNAKVLTDVYSSKFLKEHPSIIKKGERIYEGLFQPLQVWNDVHRQYLVDSLLETIKSQGKFISKFASIYIQWATRAEAVSIAYVSKSFLSLKILEAEKKRPGSKLIKWFEDISRSVQSSLIDDYSMIIRAPIFRPIKLQPTIERILKLTNDNDPEKAELAKALNMSRTLMKNVENAVNVLDSQHSIGILKRELDSKHSIDYLNLDRKGRYVAESGDVKRKSIIDKSSYHLILLDNYLLITERIHDDPVKKFKIVESPIPVEYLLFRAKDKETSSNSGQPNAALDEADQFSFKIKQLGSDTSHTFYTQTREDRNKWLFSISTVKQRLSEKVKRYEPFSLSVVSDREFTYSQSDTVNKINPLPKDGALDVAIRSVEDFDDTSTKIQSNVLSACSFRYNNQDYVFLGLSLAGYVSLKGQPNSAKRLLELSNIKQCAVLEEYDLLIVLSDKKLLYFNLTDVMKVYFGTSHSVEGDRFSRQSVSFFAVARNYENTTMIFFMKPKARVSNFKILVPIRDSVSKKFDFFLEHKKFCVDCDTYKMTLFKNSFVVHTSKGFELMSLSVLKPHPIPALHYSDLFVDGHTSGNYSSVKKRLNSNNLKPVGIFRLYSSGKFLLVYSQFAVFVNRESEIVGECIEFQFKCKSAALDHDYLIVTNDQVIEVWMIGNDDAKIVQFFTGENVVLLDDTPGEALVSMTHPKHPERQLVLSFCLKNQFKRVVQY
ncbi:Rho guanine nucleotide exchange factor [Komagataella phaffii CBS 7435]|uniref:Guanine nucleotide exchange factor (GEF) n=2 Tax=Komagataella phaffii TaxID=460519 RepID=C4R148_KOMPG|nr:Guanine nucleotide exchange factor (GEF) [Komagataella phaffii GS115]AOA62851.1 GQ67_00641T0 [Komagataella phaffii]CAH2448252.1 Rho guanine nucleotide exchange factor [Komagataella phaffii CBS 7435]AOA67392.1 GQ68_00747T0 [Komagataella phaffii GS115]CAY69222.1 Guanine nucleotide exchange factor (GEF) [Komagataella phaffii GS115]CCA38387.1 Rho guanine nucleotide exchange factor [Komagataella phaffii CBS 7435]